MNSLVDEYLLYISSLISNYSKVVLNNVGSFNIEKLTDIVYDYLNEVFLLKANAGEINFSKSINIKLNEDENSLLNIICEYGIIDRVKLKDKNIKKSYMIVVDTINYFISVFKNTYKNADVFYSQVSQKILKNQRFIDKVLLKDILSDNEDEIEKIYKKSCSTIKKLKKNDNLFGYNIQKISKDMVFVTTSYNNEDIYNYNEKESKFVLKDYQRDLYLSSLENLSIKIIEELFDNKKVKYFIYVPEYILKSKTVVKSLLKIFNVYVLCECVCFIIDSDVYSRTKDIDDMFEAYHSGVYLKNYNEFNFDALDYMIIEYDTELDSIVDKYNKRMDIIINGKIGNKHKDELMEKEIKYFSKIRVEE